MGIFDNVQSIRIKKSNFDLSYVSLATGKMGMLMPIDCIEVLPGDRFDIVTSVFLRYLGLKAPIFSDVNISIHYWFCPNRILWKNWNNFIKAKQAGEESPVHPYKLFSGGVTRGSLADYLGLPPNLNVEGEEIQQLQDDEKVNALPFRAVAKIYNEFYRDETLQEELPFSDEDGLDETTNIDNIYRAWKKDYFTSARPEQQLGDGVVVPIGDKAPVIGNGQTIGLVGKNSSTGEKISDRGVGVYDGNYLYSTAPIASNVGDSATSNPTTWSNGTMVGLSEDAEKSGVVADLSNASAIDIVKLRLAFQMQKFKERAARVGNRIKEFYLAHWGVRSSDARLDLPEYLGGSTSQSVFSEVIQTSETTQQSQLGALGGHGVGFNIKKQVKNHYFEEYGFIIGLLNIQPKSAYCQGLHKKWSRESEFDYPLPVFQHVGEQEILNKEIQANHSDKDGVFGYAPRYAEFKHNQDEFHGDFCGSLNDWHLGRIFEAGVDKEAKLNSEFIKANPSDRIFAVTDGSADNIIFKINHNIVARRRLDYYSNPGLVDHF